MTSIPPPKKKLTSSRFIKQSPSQKCPNKSIFEILMIENNCPIPKFHRLHHILCIKGTCHNKTLHLLLIQSGPGVLTPSSYDTSLQDPATLLEGHGSMIYRYMISLREEFNIFTHIIGISQHSVHRVIFTLCYFHPLTLANVFCPVLFHPNAVVF